MSSPTCLRQVERRLCSSQSLGFCSCAPLEFRHGVSPQFWSSPFPWPLPLLLQCLPSLLPYARGKKRSRCFVAQQILGSDRRRERVAFACDARIAAVATSRRAVVVAGASLCLASSASGLRNTMSLDLVARTAGSACYAHCAPRPPGSTRDLRDPRVLCAPRAQAQAQSSSQSQRQRQSRSHACSCATATAGASCGYERPAKRRSRSANLKAHCELIARAYSDVLIVARASGSAPARQVRHSKRNS